MVRKRSSMHAVRSWLIACGQSSSGDLLEVLIVLVNAARALGATTIAYSWAASRLSATNAYCV